MVEAVAVSAGHGGGGDEDDAPAPTQLAIAWHLTRWHRLPRLLVPLQGLFPGNSEGRCVCCRRQSRWRRRSRRHDRGHSRCHDDDAPSPEPLSRHHCPPASRACRRRRGRGGGGSCSGGEGEGGGVGSVAGGGTAEAATVTQSGAGLTPAVQWTEQRETVSAFGPRFAQVHETSHTVSIEGTLVLLASADSRLCIFHESEIYIGKESVNIDRSGGSALVGMLLPAHNKH